MPHSDLQIEANRANAQHSTGPRTPEGKHRSSLNATRHGLTGQVVVLPGEDLRVYQTFCQEFFDEWRPQGPTEKHLVQTLADQQWRLHRAHARERAVYALGHDRLGGGIETERPDVHAILTAALVDIEQSKELERLGRHASRIQRDYNSTLKELKAFRSERRQQETAELREAAQVQKLFEMKKIQWDPADDGFVLSRAQIATYLRRIDHVDEAKMANKVDFDLKRFLAATN